MFFLNFINRCSSGYLSIVSECESKKYCGENSDIDSNIFISCSNIVILSYLSSNANNENNQFRGFNIYYEGIK